mmetsp:Transcript_46383/g.83927  ORF Transcript_46383/g.83927 Transcript_46383/m.83927 type:complete len:210 (+) Transcript_46383:127-756(+)
MGNGKSKEETVKEKAREWQRQLRSECRRLDRDINKIRQEEEKLKREIQSMAKKGQAQSVKTLARQVVRMKKSTQRLERTKVSLNSVNLHLTTAVAQMSVGTSLKMSASMMKDMNKLMNIPELASTMRTMQQEMAKADMMDEMIEDSMVDDDDEEEVDGEVSKVFDELGLDTAAFMATADQVSAPPVAMAAAAAEPEDDPLMKRLQDLKS